MSKAVELSPVEIRYLTFVVRGDLEILQNTGSLEDEVEKVMAVRLLDKLQAAS